MIAWRPATETLPTGSVPYEITKALPCRARGPRARGTCGGPILRNTRCLGNGAQTSRLSKRSIKSGEAAS